MPSTDQPDTFQLKHRRPALATTPVVGVGVGSDTGRTLILPGLAAEPGRVAEVEIEGGSEGSYRRRRDGQSCRYLRTTGTFPLGKDVVDEAVIREGECAQSELTLALFD